MMNLFTGSTDNAPRARLAKYVGTFASLALLSLVGLAVDHPLSFSREEDPLRKRRLDAPERQGGAAFVVSVCSGVDYVHSDPMAQITRAEHLLDTLVRVDSKLPRVMLVSGFKPSDYSHLVKETEDAAFGFDKVVTVPYDDLTFKIRHKGDGLMPVSDTVFGRQDGSCTTLKLSAWKLVEYDVIFHTDTDICFHENPNPYVNDFVNEPDRLFKAFCEISLRGWMGFNTHMMMFRPNLQIAQLLHQKIQFGDFIGYTNTEQDVIETLYSPSSECVDDAKFPRHTHAKGCPVKYDEQRPKDFHTSDLEGAFAQKVAEETGRAATETERNLSGGRAKRGKRTARAKAV